MAQTSPSMSRMSCERECPTPSSYRVSSDAQLFLQCLHAIARDRELGLLLVLQAQQHPPGKPRVQLVHVRRVDNCGAMNSDEALGVEFRLKVRNGQIQTIVLA